MRKMVGLGLVGAALLAAGAGRAAAQGAPSYVKQVKPFLARYCVECHNADTARGRVNLESYQALMRGRKGRPTVVPGRPDESRLVLTTEHKVRPPMPPKKAKQPGAADKAMLRAWVAAGARDDSAAQGALLPRLPAETPGVVAGTLPPPAPVLQTRPAATD